MKILSFSFANPNLDINVGRLAGTSCHPSNSLYISVESNLSNLVDPDSPPVTIKTLKYKHKLSIHLIISTDLPSFHLQTSMKNSHDLPGLFSLVANL